MSVHLFRVFLEKDRLNSKFADWICKSAEIYSKLMSQFSIRHGEFCKRENHFHFASVQIRLCRLNFLRLGPYSPQLNPIEILWSSVKAYVKRQMAERLNDLLNVPEERTIKEHRMSILEEIANGAMEMPSIPRTCLNSCNHVRRFYAPCIEMEDLQVGVWTATSFKEAWIWLICLQMNEETNVITYY